MTAGVAVFAGVVVSVLGAGLVVLGVTTPGVVFVAGTAPGVAAAPGVVAGLVPPVAVCALAAMAESIVQATAKQAIATKAPPCR